MTRDELRSLLCDKPGLAKANPVLTTTFGGYPVLRVIPPPVDSIGGFPVHCKRCGLDDPQEIRSNGLCGDCNNDSIEDGFRHQVRSIGGFMPAKPQKSPTVAPVRKKQGAGNALATAIVKYLTLKGVFCWKTGQGAFKVGDRFIRMGTPGVADICGILPGGRFIAVEVKAGRDRVKPSQIEWMALASRQGALVFVARKLEDVMKELPL